MSYEMRRPCSDCPFLRDGGIRLTRTRVKEIAGMMLSPSGGTFPCHKTVDQEQRRPSEEQHCAGALIFAEKNGNATQMMRIAERLGMYDAHKLESQDAVFDTIEEMERAAIRRGSYAATRKRKSP